LTSEFSGFFHFGFSWDENPQRLRNDPQGKRRLTDEFPVPIKVHGICRFHPGGGGSVIVDFGHLKVFPGENGGEKPVETEGLYRVNPADVQEAIVRLSERGDLHALSITLNISKGDH
jgi:hypothetical protein